MTLARTKRGLTKGALAKKASVSSGYLTQLEAPRDGAEIKHPGVQIMQRLADALDVPVGWLAFGTEPESTWPEEAPAVTADEPSDCGAPPAAE